MMPQHYIYFSLYLMLCANEMICSCRCWESSGRWNQFKVYRRNKLTWAIGYHRLGNYHWIRILNHLLPIICLRCLFLLLSFHLCPLIPLPLLCLLLHLIFLHLHCRLLYLCSLVLCLLNLHHLCCDLLSSSVFFFSSSYLLICFLLHNFLCHLCHPLLCFLFYSSVVHLCIHLCFIGSLQTNFAVGFLTQIMSKFSNILQLFPNILLQIKHVSCLF